MVQKKKKDSLAVVPKKKTRTKPNKLTNNNYIDDSKFLEIISQFKIKLREAEDQGLPKPIIPDYIGECFLLIAKNLAFRPNFIGYTFKEDMISDGIENCLKYVHNFDHEKYKKPFAYFTQIVFWAFVRRIQLEKKEAYFKYKLMEEYESDLVTDDPKFSHLTCKKSPASKDFEKFRKTFIENFEESKKRKLEKVKTKSKLEKLLSENA